MSEDHNVGILGVEVYFPSTYVSQEELEVANGVSSGKYTVGLGQEAMAFTGDHEDVNSISLTVVQALLEKYAIDPKEVGRLEVGTETLVDKSKSTKTILMSLFESSGNTDIEGATVVNACYGGTAALINALTWVDSNSWDGRYAIVVAADIAVYAEGPARPAGGCGSVALLIGRNAPLVIDLKTRSTFAVHSWDFFKPALNSEYPVVNGALSQTLYLRSLDDCYRKIIAKSKSFRDKSITVDNTDYLLLHSPYNKLVQKGFGRLVFQDMCLGSIDSSEAAKWINLPLEKTYEDRDLEAFLKKTSVPGYKSKVDISCKLSKQIGNTYTASVYMNLANLISSIGSDLVGKSVLLFSYGSGSLATMLSITPRLIEGKFNLGNTQRLLNISGRLLAREKLSPKDLTEALRSREDGYGVSPFVPKFSSDKLFPGTFYLKEVTAQCERIYERKPLNSVQKLGGSLVVCNVAEAVGLDLNSSAPDDSNGNKAPVSSVVDSALVRNKTYVWASGRTNVNVVVTGVAAALPGRDQEVFPVGINNIERIIEGESFLTPIPDLIKDDMISKNIFETVKSSDGSMAKIPIDTYEKSINLSASLGKFSLSAYGVSASIVGTMDKAVQVAIAAGLEALKDAGIVTGVGKGTAGWELPLSMQNSTGIVYATSFPALDTAVEEVSKYFKTRSVENVDLDEIFFHLKKKLSERNGVWSDECETALKTIETVVRESSVDSTSSPYEFDRKFLFRVLVLGNAQLAQIIKAKGPNMQSNAACAGATQAIALAYDMIQVGRAERVIVIAGDNAASDTLLPWLGNGFRVLGAANICSDPKLAARPFHPNRCGMILGSGGIGMVLESEEGALRRYQASPIIGKAPYKCRLLGTLVSNSAYHGASMDKEHIAEEMERFISSIEKELGISRKQIAREGVYFSHETSTHASPSSSCAANEIFGLRKVFGDELKNLLILNTKGYTGHPMGVSFEDVVAAEVLVRGRVPPIANFSDVDPYLGELKLSQGGSYNCKYAMRFAAGFGSQIALALYGTADSY